MSSQLFPARIEAVQSLTRDIRLLTLVSKTAESLPPFTAGAHITVRTPMNSLRHYSLCSNPADLSRYQIAIKREGRGRGGSLSLVDSSRVGGELWIGAPENNFALEVNAWDAQQFLLIAGGIGITPIIAMLHELQAREQAGAVERYRLIYLTRSAEDTAFLDYLAPMIEKGLATVHHDHGNPDEQFDFWPIFETPTSAHVYCCGPAALMDSVRDMTGHWPQKQIHFESFGGDVRAHSEDGPFQVMVNSSQQLIDVDVGQSILDALRLNGVIVQSSCESGTCGTCRTGLLSGEADHRDLVLFDDEKQSQIMVCVSRAKMSTDTADGASNPMLVLDL